MTDRKLRSDCLVDYRGALLASIAIIDARKKYDDALRTSGVERLTRAMAPHLGDRAAEERARNMVSALIDPEEDPALAIASALDPRVFETQGYPPIGRRLRAHIGVSCLVAWAFAKADAAKAAGGE